MATAPFRIFVRDENANVVVMTAFAMIPLMLAIGGAIDLGRAYVFRSQLSYAADAAALAGAQSLDDAKVQLDARAYFNANFAPEPGAGSVDTISVRLDPDEAQVEVDVEATMPTTFLRLANIDTIDLTTRAVARRDPVPLELALVLDTTGSMSKNGKIQALRAASRKLVDILYERPGSEDYVRIALAPYAGAVRLDTGLHGLVDDEPEDWNGCLGIRDGSAAFSDAPPSVKALVPDTGATGVCTANRIKPMNNVPATIKDDLADLNATGNTRIDIGASWGWRLISPRWQGVWTGVGRPDDYDDASDKAMIILTDGKNVPRSPTTRAQANANLSAVCEDAKREGIEIFTITFQAPASVQPMMRDCASEPGNYYESPSNQALEIAFRSIARKLAQLRLTS
ncbi:MAG: pilus assembly protein TadG-related protein [Geminicoccaceae bacterium]